MPSRVEMLKTFAQQRPNDPFPKYGLALEFKNAGDLAAARSAFEALLAAHPDYVPGYLHAGNTLVALGQRDDAAALYRKGIEVAGRSGDAHARGELEGALASLG